MQYHLSDIKQIAQQIIALLSEHRIFFLEAEMGSGKTTLVHAICELLQIHEHCSSPTYAIVNEYSSKQLNKTIAHIDLYRLKDADDLENSGVLDYLQNPNCICFVEWPELAFAYIDSAIQIKLKLIDEHRRECQIIKP